MFMALAKEIAWKIVEKKYAGTDIADDKECMNRLAMQWAGAVGIGMVVAIALIIWAVIKIVALLS